MGKIIRNGIEYGGTYDSATSVNYDNSVSGLNARTVQEGIDQLNESLVASDNLKFQFATDGEGNYGYLGADDSFIPFKSNLELETGTFTMPYAGNTVSIELGYKPSFIIIDKFSDSTDYVIFAMYNNGIQSSSDFSSQFGKFNNRLTITVKDSGFDVKFTAANSTWVGTAKYYAM